MRLERLNQDKIRIFLTFDDLTERGINKEDMWQDIPKVHELFNDMMNQAYRELNFEVQGPVAVEIFSLPAQGMVVVVTKGKYTDESIDGDEDLAEEYYELEVTLDESDDILFRFRDFEEVIRVAHQLRPFIDDGGYLYVYEGKYFLLFTDVSLEAPVYDLFIAILSEFGEPSTLSKYVLHEYGKMIMDENAVNQLCRYFTE